jgi:hypothetical protein|tara:strand:+ start:48 stop:227 length:180 start_codon:yes stop_codon:yes gene_type:complete
MENGLEKFKKAAAKKKSKVITFRATKKDYDWIKKNKISPSKIFDNFLAEIKKKSKKLHG